MESLQVSTIFYSIQGEATHTGVASIFIRFFDCNLDCSFCDDLLHTDKSQVNSYTYEDVLSRLKDFNTKHVILTGGEPSLYNLNDFISFLQEHGYYVCIETNGFNFKNIKNANWITYSPKDWDNITVHYANEFKFIVDEQSNIQPLLNLQTKKPIYIQPQNNIETLNKKNVDYCIELVKKYQKFRFSLQMHKVVGIL